MADRRPLPMPGSVFPPRDHRDIAAYPDDDVVQGYFEADPTELEPGPNHAPGFRWGWTNRLRDQSGKGDDGFDAMRDNHTKASRQENSGAPPSGPRQSDEFFHAIEREHIARYLAPRRAVH